MNFDYKGAVGAVGTAIKDAVGDVSAYVSSLATGLGGLADKLAVPAKAIFSGVRQLPKTIS